MINKLDINHFNRFKSFNPLNLQYTTFFSQILYYMQFSAIQPNNHSV